MAIVAAGAASALAQTRAGEHSASIDAQSLTAEQIYWRIRNGPGNGDLVVAQGELIKLEERYSARDGELSNLAAKLDAAWQGDAASSAVANLAPLHRAFQESTSSLQQLEGAVRDQIESFSRIYHAVEEVPAEPPRSGIVNDVNPFTTDTDRAINDYNQKAAANVARYETYNRDSTTNGDRMPTAYPSLPVDIPSISVSDSSTNGKIGGFATDGVTTASAANPADAAVPRQNVPNTGPAAPSPDHRGEGPPVVPSGRSDRGSTRPSQAGQASPSRLGDPSAPTRHPGAPGPAGTIQPGVGGSASPRIGGGGRGVSGGAGRVAGGSANAGRREGSADPLGRGSASGTADTSTGLRRSATPVGGAAPATGIGGGPYGTASATPRDDDDTEHKSVLIQPDPDQLFGLQDATAPAVIGEDEDA